MNRGPLRIGIDLTALLPQPTGVDRYLTCLIDGLAALAAPDQFVLFVNREDYARFANHPLAEAVHSWSRRVRLARLFFQQGLLPALVSRYRLDVLHSPSFILPLAVATANVLTVYDMTSFTLPNCHAPMRRSVTYRFAVDSSIKRAQVVTVPSHTVRNDLLEILPETSSSKVRVVTPGIAGEFRPAAPSETASVLNRLGLPSRYILSVGTLQPRKNLVRLIESYRLLLSRKVVPEHLVLFGRRGWEYRQIMKAATEASLAGRVHFADHVGSDDLIPLLSGARLLIYPSLGEGFGFPPLEAMACATPVIASDNSSLRENLAGAALLVDPYSVEALEGAMRRVLENPEQRESMIAAGRERAIGFRWSRTAKETLACYYSAAAQLGAAGGDGLPNR